LVTHDGKVDFDRAQPLLGIKGDALSNPQDHSQVQEIVAAWEQFERLAHQAAAQAAQSNFERVREKRQRQADASVYSLDAFQKAKANRLKGSLQNYQLRLFEGEDMDISIRRAQYELERLDADCALRRQQIEARRQIQANAPSLLNVVLLVTKP
jgi:hypothetical protein